MKKENAQLTEALKASKEKEKELEEKLKQSIAVEPSNVEYQLQEVETKNCDLELALQKHLQEKKALQELWEAEKSAMQSRIAKLQVQVDELVLSKTEVSIIFIQGVQEVMACRVADDCLCKNMMIYSNLLSP